MADGARLYQILRGRLYERLPLLALALGLLDWREGEKTGTDGRFFYAPISFLEQAVRSPEGAEKTLLHSVLHAMLRTSISKRPTPGRLHRRSCLLTPIRFCPTTRTCAS